MRDLDTTTKKNQIDETDDIVKSLLRSAFPLSCRCLQNGFGPYKGHLDHDLDDGWRYQTLLQCNNNNNNKQVILIQPVDSKVIVVVA